MLWCSESVLDVRQGVCSPVVGVGALRVGLDQALLSLSVCPAPKELIPEAWEACAVTEDPCSVCDGFCVSAQKEPKVASLSLLCSSKI